MIAEMVICMYICPLTGASDGHLLDGYAAVLLLGVALQPQRPPRAGALFRDALTLKATART